MPPPRENAWVFVTKLKLKNLKGTYRRAQMLRISLKYCKRVTPEVQIYGQNSKIFTVFGAVFPHFCPDIGTTCRRCGAKKPIFGPPSKNNFFCKNRPARNKKSYNTTTGFEHTTYAINPEQLAHRAMAAVGDIGVKVQYKLVHVRYTPARG